MFSERIQRIPKLVIFTYNLKTKDMKKILRVIAFPFILLLSAVKALLTRPFVLTYSKKGGLEIGIVPFVLIILLFNRLF